MKLNKAETLILKETQCIIHWWNFRKKTLDIHDTLENVVKAKKIDITKSRHPDHSSLFIYTLKFNIGSDKVVIKRQGNEMSLVDIIVNALTYTLVYLGDKSQIETNGIFSRYKSINH